MEDNNKLVKVYSNQSKKTHLKRNKNKFQRVWDAEKQTYIKVRKAKYPVRKKNIKKDWRDIDSSKAIARRQKALKKPKSVPVNVQQIEVKAAKLQKPETKQEARKEQARVHTSIKTANVLKINGVNHTWDSKELCYKRASLY